ncbi:N-acetylmuramoyl-L-alanine amidase [Thiomicrorhabdus sp.]|uniref:N-acetylmuramoyl-L-alanine amidase n=1 Tax=Thiomicrorhabdus sp. TaxID=2039724 RepID=UPI003564DD86
MKSLSFTKTFITASLAALLLFNASLVYAGAELDKMRVGQKSDKTRVVFDIKQNHDFKVYKLNNPSRVVVDFYKTANKLDFKNKYYKDSRLYRVRVSDAPKSLRIVLDLHKNYDYNFFTLGKNKEGAERLVIDLVQPNEKVAKTQPSSVQPVKSADRDVKAKTSLLADKHEKVKPLISQSPAKPLVVLDSTVKNNVAREVKQNQATQSLLNKDSSILVKGDTLVVAIDPGHGGKDVGAVGHNRIYEKDATLQMSRELKRLIDQQPGMRAVLTRDRDVFIPLHERVKIAKQHHADIFISVHADAFHDRSVQGGSVYVLSNGGASSVMARLLAKSENASLQDIKLKGRDSDVAFALSDLTREANIRASRKLGRSVLREMQKSVHMHKPNLQSAEFAVLKSIDMPSLLVETAFISNPSEARKLMSSAFQTKMASSIVRGLQKFVDGNSQKPHWGETLYVHYKVQPGDTLSEIASNYQVSTKALKKLNGIKNANQLYVGRQVKIPLSDQVVAGL